MNKVNGFLSVTYQIGNVIHRDVERFNSEIDAFDFAYNLAMEKKAMAYVIDRETGDIVDRIDGRN